MIKDEILALELKKLGLHGKEAQVYLACLKLGIAPISRISRISHVTRPTGYRITQDLEKKGLVETVPQKKGVIKIRVNSPDSLLGIIKAEKKKLEEKEREFLRTISLLQSKYFLENEQGFLSYKGVENKKFIFRNLEETNAPLIWAIYSDYYMPLAQELEKIYENIYHRTGNLEIREIYIDKKPKKRKSKQKFIQRKYFFDSPFSNFHGLLFIHNQVALLKNDRAYSIQQEDLVSFYKVCISLMWDKIK